MRRLLAALGLLAILLVWGCSENADPTRPNDFTLLTSLGITSESPFIAQGTSNQFSAIGNFSGAFTRDLTEQAVWGSSDPAVLTVSNAAGSRGLATAGTPGTATVTAEVDGFSAEVDFTVTDAEPISVLVTPETASVNAGLSFQFAATGTFSDDSTQDITRDALWSSSDESVATVSNDAGSIGLATALAAGEAAIGAAFGGVAGSAALTVTEAELDSIAITPADSEIADETTVQLAATGTFSDGTTRDITDEVLWTSDDETVVTVSNTGGSEGLATAEAPGTATIEATLDDVVGATDLTVTDAVLETIEISPVDPVIAVGARQQFTATGTFSDNSTQDVTRDVSWSSDDAEVATVSNDSGSRGLARGIAEGDATITAEKGDVSDSTVLSVE